MTRYERAAQLWSVLTLAARHQHILSYDIAGRLTGLPRQAVGDNLAPIQDYCLQNSLPPMTALVVSEETGLPSEGFTAAEDVLPAQNRVLCMTGSRVRHLLQTILSEHIATPITKMPESQRNLAILRFKIGRAHV